MGDEQKPSAPPPVSGSGGSGPNEGMRHITNERQQPPSHPAPARPHPILKK